SRFQGFGSVITDLPHHHNPWRASRATAGGGVPSPYKPLIQPTACVLRGRGRARGLPRGPRDGAPGPAVRSAVRDERTACCGSRGGEFLKGFLDEKRHTLGEGHSRRVSPRRPASGSLRVALPALRLDKLRKNRKQA